MKVNLFMFCYPVTLENFVKIYLWFSFIIKMLGQLIGIVTFDWSYIERQGKLMFVFKLIGLVVTYIALVQYYRLDKHYTIYQKIKGYLDVLLFILQVFLIIYISISNLNISVLFSLAVQFYYIHTYLYSTQIQDKYYFQSAQQEVENNGIQEPVLTN